jgi:arsenate reductase (glutaredoxin)
LIKEDAMLTIYHNARCSKSREGLQILKDSGKDFKVREYLKEPLSEAELLEILQHLKIAPIQLVRTQEKLWKENFKDRDLNDEELVRVMAEHPKLIERPVVVKDDQAVIGRPPSRINDLF